MRVGESGLQTAAQVEPLLTEASGFPSPKDSAGTKVEPAAGHGCVGSLEPLSHVEFVPWMAAYGFPEVVEPAAGGAV